MLKRRLTLIVKVDNSLRMIDPAQAARDEIAAQFRYFFRAVGEATNPASSTPMRIFSKNRRRENA